MAQKEFLIHELAKRAGVTVRTIRYYSIEGLLPPPVIRGKFAYYTEAHLERLTLIQQLKQLNLPLRDIRDTINHTSPERIRELLVQNAAPDALSSSTEYSGSQPASPGSDALDYITRVRTLHDELNVPKFRVRNQPPTLHTLVSPAPYPQPSGEGDQGGSEFWRRVILAPGIEIHLREPVDPATEKHLKQIVDYAQKLFNRVPKGGRHEPK